MFSHAHLEKKMERKYLNNFFLHKPPQTQYNKIHKKLKTEKRKQKNRKKKKQKNKPYSVRNLFFVWHPS